LNDKALSTWGKEELDLLPKALQIFRDTVGPEKAEEILAIVEVSKKYSLDFSHHPTDKEPQVTYSNIPNWDEDATTIWQTIAKTLSIKDTKHYVDSKSTIEELFESRSNQG
jgi:hypothetical protein